LRGVDAELAGLVRGLIPAVVAGVEEEAEALDAMRTDEHAVGGAEGGRLGAGVTERSAVAVTPKADRRKSRRFRGAA